MGMQKVILLGVSSVFLMVLIIVVVVTMGHESEDAHESGTVTSKKAITDICQMTDYQKTCEKSLASSDHNATDPKQLIRISFVVAIKEIQNAINNSDVVKMIGDDPRLKAAYEDCKEMSYIATKDLKRSIDNFDKFDLSTLDQLIADVRVWLSGTVTYQETCLNGFKDVDSDTNSDSAEVMKKVLNLSMELTSNALAMITEISSVLTSLENLPNNQPPPVSNRRLLWTDLPPVLGHNMLFPGWIEVGKERLLLAKPGEILPDVVVAKDGSGKFLTINEALVDVPRNSLTTFVIYVKEGIYLEKVEIASSMKHVMLIGDGPNKTRITGSLNFKDGVSTYHTATVAVHGDNFFAKDIAFENSAGPEKHQAVALRVTADKAIFQNCQMDGYQDTLYAHTYRQFYRDCTISGTIDFVFGDGSALFQNCTFIVRKPMKNQRCIVTAQGRKDVRQPTGLVLQNCTFKGDVDFTNEFEAYLGRPWKQYSRTVIMESYIGDLIRPDGWLPWNDTFALDTLFYTEYNNRGPGAPKEKRIKWPGIKELTQDRIRRFTAERFLEGNKWIQSTGVPYDPDLIYPPPLEHDVTASPSSREEGIDINVDKEKIVELYHPFTDPAAKQSQSTIDGFFKEYFSGAPSPKPHAPANAPSPANSPNSEIFQYFGPAPTPQPYDLYDANGPAESPYYGPIPAESPNSKIINGPTPAQSPNLEILNAPTPEELPNSEIINAPTPAESPNSEIINAPTPAESPNAPIPAESPNAPTPAESPNAPTPADSPNSEIINAPTPAESPNAPIPAESPNSEIAESPNAPTPAERPTAPIPAESPNSENAPIHAESPISEIKNAPIPAQLPNSEIYVAPTPAESPNSEIYNAAPPAESPKSGIYRFFA